MKEILKQYRKEIAIGVGIGLILIPIILILIAGFNGLYG